MQSAQSATAIGLIFMSLASTAAFAQTERPLAAEQRDNALGAPQERLTSDPVDEAIGDEIIVTAQKRSESINSVGMSISAATGSELLERGISSAADLGKIVPGFTYTESAYATPVYTIRGIGFQENSLGASPTVSVYVDEVPLPYAVMTEGAALDVERVEVLKGPQGTLYGQNSTGGAVNYIAAKPTSTFEAGVSAEYGRFETLDARGYISGPLTDRLKARVSVRALYSDGWQKSHTRDDELGEKNILQGRVLIDWEAAERLRVGLSLSGWRNRSDTLAAQYTGLPPLPSERAALLGRLATYPIAPANARSADWDKGRDYARNDSFWQASGRVEFDLTDALQFTSLTAYQKFKKDQLTDLDGTDVENFLVQQDGRIETIFQELRLSGEVGDRLNFIVGANFERDKTFDQYGLQFSESTSRITLGLPFEGARNFTRQEIDTYAAYGNIDINLTSTFSLQGGLRYTETKRDFFGCTQDSGNGNAAGVTGLLLTFLSGQVVPTPPLDSCLTIKPDLSYGPVEARLDESNVSWRAGVEWEPRNRMLVYANVSRGYKSGSFPTLSAAVESQFSPVVQESVLAYEAGLKMGFRDPYVQLGIAGFYYDYSDKQIRGKVADVLFGTLEGLINIPKSRVYGFEASATVEPFVGLRLSPSVTYVNSRIRGNFSDFDPFGELKQLGGESFPYTPEWYVNADAEYRWAVGGNLNASVGASLSHQSATNGGFGSLPAFRVKPYTIIDLRAAIEPEGGRWRVGAFVRNLTNEYYWSSVVRLQDTIRRYPGMPTTYGITVGYKFQ